MELVYEIAWMMSIYHMVIFKNKTCQIAYLVWLSWHTHKDCKNQNIILSTAHFKGYQNILYKLSIFLKSAHLPLKSSHFCSEMQQPLQ